MKRIHQEEDGFILVISMGILVILSFIGIAGNRNTSMELQIAGNDRTAKEIFYDAESAATEAAVLLNDEDKPDELVAPRTSKKWITKKLPNGKDLVRASAVKDIWADDGPLGALPSGITTGNKVVKLAVIDHGVAKGKKASSLKITSKSVHEFHLYGYGALGNNWDTIEIGYRKRF